MKNKVAECISAVVAPATKLIEVVSKGIGTLYEPHKIKKMAEAEAYRIKVIGQAIAENDNLPIDYMSNGLGINTTDFAALQERTVARFVKQEIQRQLNIESIADMAYDMLKDDKNKSNDQISDDWVNRFISYAQDVSDEDVKAMWSNILAGEIKQPSSFSLRTLDVLRNLSKEEAIIFKKCCSLKVSNFIPSNDELLEKYNLSFRELLIMDDCGLVNATGYLSRKIEIDENNNLLFHNGNLMVLVKAKTENNKFNLPIYLFTKQGEELASIVSEKISDEFVLDYAKKLKDKNKNFDFFVHKINFIKDNNIDYEEANLLDK